MVAHARADVGASITGQLNAHSLLSHRALRMLWTCTYSPPPDRLSRDTDPDRSSRLAARPGAGAAIVGHSLGGMVAALWATTHAECPLAVNIDGHGSPSSPGQYAGLEPKDALAALTFWTPAGQSRCARPASTARRF